MIRSPDEIAKARAILTTLLAGGQLDQGQSLMLVGMSVALQWVTNEGGLTLQRLVDGEIPRLKDQN